MSGPNHIAFMFYSFSRISITDTIIFFYQFIDQNLSDQSADVVSTEFDRVVLRRLFRRAWGCKQKGMVGICANSIFILINYFNVDRANSVLIVQQCVFSWFRYYCFLTLTFLFKYRYR